MLVTVLLSIVISYRHKQHVFNSRWMREYYRYLPSLGILCFHDEYAEHLCSTNYEDVLAHSGVISVTIVFLIIYVHYMFDFVGTLYMFTHLSILVNLVE